MGEEEGEDNVFLCVCARRLSVNRELIPDFIINGNVSL